MKNLNYHKMFKTEWSQCQPFRNSDFSLFTLHCSLFMKLLFLFLILSLPLQAQTWTVEAEDVASSVTWKGHEADIIAPKGLTLWCNELMTGNTVIEYEAQITKDKHFLDKEGKPRISDLNCFWMADHLLGRQGANFTEHYALQAYYMGYGGNWNTTTRFRRYNGDKRGIDSIQYRPIVLKEYTDALHLLKANHWYKIRLEQTDGRVRYFIDGECLVDYLDPKPLTQGYFGFRTTLSHATHTHSVSAGLEDARACRAEVRPRPVSLEAAGSGS